MCNACNSKTIITLLYNQDRSFLNAVVVNYTPESQYSWLGSILEAYLCIMAALGVVVWDAYHDCCTIESALFWQRFFIFVWKIHSWPMHERTCKSQSAKEPVQISAFCNTFNNQLQASVPSFQHFYYIGFLADATQSSKIVFNLMCQEKKKTCYQNKA